MIGKTNVGGGGIGSSAWAYIGVTYPQGSTCTATNGTITSNADGTSGSYVFGIPEPTSTPETWTVSCTNGSKSKSETVSISTQYQDALVTLRYSRLPDGYQEVEYLESSGSQYIVTGYNYITYNEQVEIDYMMLNDLTHGVFGISYGSSINQGCGGRSSTETPLRYYWPNTNPTESNVTVGTKMSVVINNSNHAIVENNLTLAQNLPTPDNLGDDEIPLFCVYDYTGSEGYTLKGTTRIYKWIRTNRSTSTIVENLVPCYRTSDNVAGMIDLVSGTFRTNSGTGAFEVGPDV